MKSFKYLMAGVYSFVCGALGVSVTTINGAVIVVSGCIVIWWICTRVERGL